MVLFFGIGSIGRVGDLRIGRVFSTHRIEPRTPRDRRRAQTSTAGAVLPHAPGAPFVDGHAAVRELHCFERRRDRRRTVATEYRRWGIDARSWWRRVGNC